MNPVHDRLLRQFSYQHLPPNLQETSQRFWHLANALAIEPQAHPDDTTAALRKLLEAKDAAVRAKLP